MGCICSKETREPNACFEDNYEEKYFSPDGDNVPNQNSGSDDVENKLASVVVERPKNTPPQLQQGLSSEALSRGGQWQQMRFSRIMSVTGGERGVQVIAGWPSWLVSVAGEAINGWIPSKADSYEKLEKIGQGTYSSVYKARDIETNKIVALKKVRFTNMDPESIRFMAKEIVILRRLDHPNVMKLQGIITSRVSESLYLIFEYMEHDLAGLAATPGIKLTEAQIKCYMQQLFHGLEHCHSRGILHRDIKGANLLIDYNGNLKIADFGLATFSHRDEKRPLTSRIVSLWYRPPELLLGSTDYGAAVDLWSSGCVLAELFVGKPILPGRTEVEQLHKIFKLCGSPSEEYWKRSKLPHTTIFKPQRPYNRSIRETFEDFPASTLALLEVLLATEPELRGTVSSALQSEVRLSPSLRALRFGINLSVSPIVSVYVDSSRIDMLFFTTTPLPCDPSTLPKYRPSKEFDIKLRKDESIRRGATCGKARGNNSIRKVLQESTSILDPEFNAALHSSIQKQQGQLNTKSFIEVYHSAFPIECPKEATRNVSPCFGLSMHSGNFRPSRNMDTYKIPPIKASSRPFGTVELSRFSNSVTVRGSSRFVITDPHWPEQHFTVGFHHLDNDQSSDHLHKKPNASHLLSNESTMGYAPMDNQIHYSGPLMPPGPGENLDEMMKEHERRMRNVVRKDQRQWRKTSSTVIDKQNR
ncbi:hypothetical protein V6N12_036554 [Hibiscus sabdariffa]|uniref:Protein kinase domain-containing protein n=1 Tax=Hibiscus sabdariffa TaxID=183260 RepID=A0ABR2ER17_9ROSI